MFSIIFGLHLSIISLKFKNKIKLKKLNYRTFYLFITKELIAHHRKTRQPKNQSNIFSKRKDQVKKLLACKITYATRSNKLIKKQPPEVFCKKKGVLKIFTMCAQESTCLGVSFWWTSSTLLKRDSNTCVFLWILQFF